MRIYGPYPALVRGTDAGGRAFEERTVLDNLSADGLYLRLWRKLEAGERLRIAFEFARGKRPKGPGEEKIMAGPRVAARCVVLRVDPLPAACYGIAVRFERYRFL